MLRGVAYSSLARRLFPLNSEFMTFLAKEGLHQVPFALQVYEKWLSNNYLLGLANIYTEQQINRSIFIQIYDIYIRKV